MEDQQFELLMSKLNSVDQISRDSCNRLTSLENVVMNDLTKLHAKTNMKVDKKNYKLAVISLGVSTLVSLTVGVIPLIYHL